MGIDEYVLYCSRAVEEGIILPTDMVLMSLLAFR